MITTYHKFPVGEETWYLGYKYQSHARYAISVVHLNPREVSCLPPTEIKLADGTIDVISGYWSSNFGDFLAAATRPIAYYWSHNNDLYNWWLTSWPENRIDLVSIYEKDQRSYHMRIAGITVRPCMPPHLNEQQTPIPPHL